jgi:hypothetical protein
MLFVVIFMGLLPLGFILYVWGISKFVFRRKGHFCSDNTQTWSLGMLHIGLSRALGIVVTHSNKPIARTL